MGATSSKPAMMRALKRFPYYDGLIRACLLAVAANAPNPYNARDVCVPLYIYQMGGCRVACVLHVGVHFLRVTVFGAHGKSERDTHELRGGASVLLESVRRLALPPRRSHVARHTARV
jgi:hypothetical protein